MALKLFPSIEECKKYSGEYKYVPVSSSILADELQASGADPKKINLLYHFLPPLSLVKPPGCSECRVFAVNAGFYFIDAARPR